MPTIQVRFKVAEVLTDPTSIVLADEDSLYGVKRLDTGEAVAIGGLSVNIPLTREDTGIYSVSFDDPAPGLSYAYVARIIYNGKVYYSPGTADGAPAASTGITLSPYALATLEQVKRELLIEDDSQDDLLIQAINEESAAFEKLVDRQIAARDRVELVRVQGGNVMLRQYPVSAVYRAATEQTDAMRVSYSGTALKVLLRVTDTALALRIYAANGTVSNHSFAFATYATASALAAQLELIEGLTAAVILNVPACYLLPTAGADAKQQAVSVMAASGDTLAEVVLGDAGIIGLSGGSSLAAAWGPGIWPSCGWALVEYRAGYETVPQDIAAAVVDAVKERYMLAGASTGMTGEKLGDYSYTYAGGGSSSSESTTYSNVVEAYRRVLVG